jgi:protein-glutamine gamma-glutamyltransferase
MRKMAFLSLLFINLAFWPFSAQHSLLILIGMFSLTLLASYIHYKKKTLPKYIRYFFLIFSVVLVNVEYGSWRGLIPGLSLLSFLSVIKIFEIKNKRDFYIFLLLAELSLVGHLLSVESLLMLIYVVFMNFLLFLLLGYAQQEDEHFDKKKFIIFSRIFTLSVVLTGLLFMIFPRFLVGNFSFNTSQNMGGTGFSNKISPGDLAKVALDRSPVFRARFKQGDQLIEELYWRGGVLGKAKGLTWEKGGESRFRNLEYFGRPYGDYHVEFERSLNGALLVLEGTSDIYSLSPMRVSREAGETYTGLSLASMKIRYDAVLRKSRVKGLSSKDRQRYLTISSSGNKRFKKWAEQFKLSNLNVKEMAEVFKKYIEKEEFVYTLSPGTYKGKNSLDKFFFDRKEGFCEHFAASMGMFFRHLGIPSRLVVGYQGGLLNPVGEYYIIRGEDAHAWVETWDKIKGWVRFDPTFYVAPGRIRLGANDYFERVEEGTTRGLGFFRNQSGNFLKKLYYLGDMFYYEMNRRFISYDSDIQKKLFSFLGKGKKRIYYLLGICLIIFSLIFGVIILRLSRENKRDKADRIYFKFILMLKREMNIPGWWGPHEIRRNLNSNGHLSKDGNHFLELYQGLRYNPQESRSVKELEKLFKGKDLLILGKKLN